jgi:hypothetical protein
MSCPASGPRRSTAPGTRRTSPATTRPHCPPPDGVGPQVYFQRVPEDKSGKNRLHICLQPTDRTRDAEVERLLGLGATHAADHREPDGTGWTVLADPEGNEFCVLRSAAERAG